MTRTARPEQDTLARSAARFLDTAQALTDDDARRASALPGWTRAHVLTHVAQAADSRTGLLRASRAGRVGVQYPSEHARAEAIEVAARRPAAVIRAGLHRAVQECLTAIGEHPAQLWDAPAIWLGAGRRPVRGVITSLRRELEYHHVDLAADYAPADWPGDFIATELSRVTALMDRRADAPPMTLTGPATVRIGTTSAVDVIGPPAAILAWLSGRGDGSGPHPDSAACRPSHRWPSPAAPGRWWPRNVQQTQEGPADTAPSGGGSPGTLATALLHSRSPAWRGRPIIGESPAWSTENDAS